MYRDYRDRNVQFFYVYKAVAHPEINNFVAPFNIEERLKHIEIAKEMFQSEMPWICDTMENDVKIRFGNAPNGEFVLDPDGKIVRKRFWSNPTTLRSDLETLVGKSETTTQVADLETTFTPKPRPIASGVVPRIKLPARLVPLALKPKFEKDSPFFAKLRVETTRKEPGSLGRKIYFGVYLDPIYKVHWNNRAGKIKIEIESDDETLKFETVVMTSADIKEDADVDPRQFLINAVVPSGKSFRVKLNYTVCDDAETFCKEMEQEYEVAMIRDDHSGTRPGVFLNEMFFNVREMDKNGDGDLTADELPPPAR